MPMKMPVAIDLSPLITNHNGLKSVATSKE
jgi:hypothetical protein